MTRSSHLSGGQRNSGRRVARTASCFAVAAVSIGIALAPSPAEADVPNRPNGNVVVIGDSMTARYDDEVGSPNRAMYSFLAEKLSMTPVTFAESGSGFYRRGIDSSCTGTRYADRISRALAANPRVLLVQGGRNDYRGCTKPVSQATTEKYTRSFLRSLALAADRSGLRRRDIYVHSPWGTTKVAEGKRIRPMIKQWTRYYGLIFISGTSMDRDDAPDGIHPDESGVQFLLAQVLRNSNLDERFG